MQIRVKLPSDYELKWKRLLAAYGPNADELAIMAVELLWAKCHRQVESSERLKSKLSTSVSAAKKRLAQIATKKKPAASVFVGKFTSRVSGGGNVAIPKEWLPALLEGKYFAGSFNFDGDRMKESRLHIFDKPKKVLCYGSSSTFGYNWQGGGRFDEETRWPTVMKKYIPGCFEVIENGVCGRTIGDYMPVKSPTNGIQSLQRIKNLAECNAVIIMLGNNDTIASPESSVTTIASGLGTMVDIIREQNKNAHILLASPVPISTNCDDKDMFMSFFESQVNKSKALPQEIKKVAEKYECTFIEAGKYVSCDGTDGIHFSAESNKLLAVYMADFLNMENWESA